MNKNNSTNIIDMIIRESNKIGKDKEILKECEDLYKRVTEI